MSEPNTNKTDRVAQYGGVGGGGSAYAPGGSPLAQYGGNPGGWGINDFLEDVPLDAIMSKTHRPAPIDPDRNIEKRLEPYHDDAEKDSLGYILTPIERERLKIKEEIRRREKYNADAAKSIRENSPSFIRANFHPKKEHVTTMEEQLKARRKMEDGKVVRHEYEDVTPPQVKPSRIHASGAQTDRTAYEIARRNQLTKEDSSELNEFDRARRTQPLGLGSTPLLDTGLELDSYLDQASKENWGGQTLAPHTPTLSFDTEEPDQIGNHDGHPSRALPSMIKEIADDMDYGIGDEAPEDDLLDIADDPFMPLEEKLEKSNRPQPESPPADPYAPNGWKRSDDGETKGITDTYPRNDRWPTVMLP